MQGLFPVDPERMSITGHSMGGHGAMVAHLKNPGMYTSVSAFAPIVNPMSVPWGEKVFSRIMSKSFNMNWEGLHWISWLCGGWQGLRCH